MIFDEVLFKQFISPECNRKDFIVRILNENGVKTAIMPVDGKNHIHVVFPKSCYNPMFRTKTVIAHYDRVPGSPGANDNSAAVFVMLQWAVSLNNPVFIHNVRLIFTDGEELGSRGVSEQGAFGLASAFKRLNIQNDDVFVFDSVGRGTVPVLAKTVLPLKCPVKFSRAFNSLQDKALSIISTVNGKSLVLPVPYSDNAGFIACGIPAAAITMLPDSEGSKLLLDTIKDPQFEKFIINNGNGFSQEQKQFYRKLFPETWNLFHTPADNFESLHPESFSVFSRLLSRLAMDLSPVSN